MPMSLIGISLVVFRSFRSELGHSGVECQYEKET